MAVKITCDSSADLSQQLYNDGNISVIPFEVLLGDQPYIDGQGITSQQIFDYVEENKVLPKTSAINDIRYSEFFEQHKCKDGLIHFSISSKISSTINNAKRAAANFEKVYVVDSLSLSSGLGILVKYASDLAKKGTSYDKIIQLVEERKNNVQISFVIDKLDYLHKGGRCSALKMLGANLLRLHPSITLKDGKMGLGDKFRGKMPECVTNYMKSTLNTFNTPCLDYCFITYSSTTPEMLENAYKVVNDFGKFKKIYETTAGCTVTSHCGKNTLGIIYFNDGKSKK